MKKFLVVASIVLASGAGYFYLQGASPAATNGPASGGGRPGNFGGGGGRGGPRMPLTVELGRAERSPMSDRIVVVGNLVAALTVETAPKVNGRLEEVTVRMGDPVRQGQVLARIEDSEIREQVKQSEASLQVAEATVRQREADLGFAESTLQRSQSLYDRQLVSRQELDDALSRQQAAAAQVDLVRAQLAQSRARLDELKITLSHTIISSPVTGYVGRRTLDPGAWVTPNSIFLSVVDISTVRLVANIVERDLSKITPGMAAEVEVDAYPGEQFMGEVARVAPVLDPATRTAQIEVDIDNAGARLRPGMYARVNFTVDERHDALVIPTNALVAVNRQNGVFVPGEGGVAAFREVEVGLQNQEFVQVLGGLDDGDEVITTGAAALREGDRILLPGQAPRDGASGAGRAEGQPAGRGAPDPRMYTQ